MKSGKNIFIGLVFGIIAGIIDVIQMIIQSLPWSANLSAFSMWVICGFFISTSGLKVYPILKGLIIALCSMIPVGVLIAFTEPFTLLPIIGMTILLGSILGFVIDKFVNKTY